MTFAWFITPHGLGHAARAAAMMAAVHARRPDISFEIFSQIPEAFLHDSRIGPFRYHDLLTDIGVVQDCALRENVAATVEKLDGFLPFETSHIAELAGRLRELKCSAVIADIAPMGLLAAHAAGLPAILVENFTWDWIYDGYVDLDPRMERHVEYLANIFSAADYHVQTEPVTYRVTADFTSGPVSRKPRTSREDVRRQLFMAEAAPAVLITMGGIPEQHGFLDALRDHGDVVFVIPGAGQSLARDGNLVVMPHASFYHPDLVAACDAVVGKVGYSTVAEVYHAGIPFGYIPRPRFREADALSQFIGETMCGIAFGEQEFRSGAWADRISELLALPRLVRNEPNGADQAAEWLLALQGRGAPL